jgi:hypothetical protein
MLTSSKYESKIDKVKTLKWRKWILTNICLFNDNIILYMNNLKCLTNLKWKLANNDHLWKNMLLDDKTREKYFNFNKIKNSYLF